MRFFPNLATPCMVRFCASWCASTWNIVGPTVDPNLWNIIKVPSPNSFATLRACMRLRSRNIACVARRARMRIRPNTNVDSAST